MPYSEREVLASFPEEHVRARYFAREDIAALPPDERERRWQEHWPRAREFMRRLAAIGVEHVIDVGGPAGHRAGLPAEGRG